MSFRRTLSDLYQSFWGGQALTSEVVAVSGTSAVSDQLSDGVHILSPNTDCWFRQGASSVVASIADGSRFLAKGAQYAILVNDVTVNGYVAVIQDSEAGYLSIGKA